MLFAFSTVLVFLAFSIIFVMAMLGVQRLLAPRAPSIEKGTPYECGEPAVGTPWIRFNPRYYVIALVFLIFDVELAFMYPCAVTFKDWVENGLGVPALLEIGAFVAVLLVGLAYAWKRGYLEWVKVVERQDVSPEADSRTSSA
ncbi:MAG: NADH-quinone oxidoreductase subunit A [Pseudomonadota bacterium]